MSKYDGENRKVCNNLEGLLVTFFNGGKKQPMFLKKVRRNEEGYVTKCLTKRGSSVYNDFVDFCYDVGNNGFKTIGDLKDFLKSLENIGLNDSDTWDCVIETTDMICEGEDYC